MSLVAPARLAGAELDLVLTTQIDERVEVAMLYANPDLQHRAAWLALGLCWPRFRRKHPYTRNPREYSSHVFNTLSSEGASTTEIFAASAAALTLVFEGMALVDGSRDFSPVPGEDGRNVGTVSDTAS